MADKPCSPESTLPLRKILTKAQAVTDSEVEVVRLSRPWHRVKRAGSPDKVFVMARRNYKVFADIGQSPYELRRICTVLDTGAGPNFIKESSLSPASREKMIKGGLPNICDANGNPLSMMGRLKLVTRLGSSLVLVDFVVCRTLAADAILGADFCDRYVEAIRPRKKLVELDDGTTVPIVRNPSRWRSRENPMPAGLKPDKSTRGSQKIRVTETRDIPAASQTWINVQCDRFGTIVVQPDPQMMKETSMPIANGVAFVRSKSRSVSW